ncbi:hypothetical protein CZ774_13790 [Frigoribacterium sp. JB110]|nr:hypothetical protein CZ774_13790 [Frigoribacterium sp. JB110]
MGMAFSFSYRAESVQQRYEPAPLRRQGNRCLWTRKSGKPAL